MQPNSPSSVRASISKLLPRVRNAAAKLSLSGTARSVLKSRLTYLSPRKLRVLERCARELDRKGVKGDFIECGIALGGSAILLASLLSPQRNFSGYDVFEMIPPPGPKDERDSHERYKVIKSGASGGIAGEQYYGYIENLRDVVAGNFDRFGVPVDNKHISLHQGLFENTLRFDPDARIALAHIDCDWHDPVRLCLERIYAQLPIGGFMILDDYNAYQGCRKATDAFLAENRDLVLVATTPNAVIRRTAVANSAN